MTLTDIGFMILITIAMFAYSWFCLKTKRVDPSYLDAQKEAIAAEITEYERTHQDI